MAWVLFLISLGYLVISVAVFVENPEEEGYTARLVGILYGAILCWAASTLFGGA